MTFCIEWRFEFNQPRKIWHSFTFCKGDIDLVLVYFILICYVLKKPLMDTNDVQSQAPVIILTSDEDTDIPYPFPFPKTFGTDLDLALISSRF